MIFTNNNTLSAVGNYRIITFDIVSGATAITSATDTVSGGSPGSKVTRFFRWSTDGASWSLWTEWSPIDQLPLTSISIDPASKFYLEMKYVAANDPLNSPELLPGSPISPEYQIQSIDVAFAYAQTDPYQNYVAPCSCSCSSEYCTNPIIKQDKFTFDPYKVNSALCLYQELSSMANGLFGHEIMYFRVSPQGRSADIVFKEWTLFQVEQQKCLKILVPNNEFPDSKPKYNQFGIDFEIPFEIHIDKSYWEGFFGRGTMPQQRDIIYFPLINRIYEVQSTYIYRDFMQQPLYFKAQLVKYQPKADTLLPDNIAQQLDDLTISTDELFQDEMEKEIKKIVKPEQYVTITHAHDPTRDRVNRSLPIDRFDLYNHWTLVSEHYYNMDALYGAQGVVDAVVYRANAAMGARDGRSIVAWFNPKVGGTSTTRHIIHGRNASNQGISVDLAYSPNANQSAVTVLLNSATYVVPLTGVTLTANTWYALVVNISNEFAQLGVNVWQPASGTAEMDMLFERNIGITPAAFDAQEPWKLRCSPIWITNVRVFDRMLEQEKQNLVLSQLVVKDSEKAILIDNAKPLLRLPRITNPK